MKKRGWEASEACPCYQAVGAFNYEIWFGYATVGTSMVYRSENKTWSEEG